ncbi:hypothetical protein BCR36DRAFT_351232 [Piromyces finnis]|uniref:DH domain-containing protein n=1 Tax=Piromyces finnis TaxID=1754191 RepID=A0A1Y1VBK4_9FUNG|nr:hypothetical protein BCR36DRAFT_351232 [Piromyces finnis]|eukprot:ORX51448.1 hypothetical protein BCR36DRAFT_351232 [Piromyces finnis]
MASSTAWKELLLKKKKTNNKDTLIDDNDEYFRFCKISGSQRHYSALLSKFIYQLIESEKIYNETLDTALNACMHLSDIKNVGFEEFLERLTLLKNSCQEILASMQNKNDEKIFINYITSATFYKIYQDYISHFNSDLIKIQKAKNENSRLQIQLKDIDLYLNAPFRRIFFYRAIYWNILRCKNQKTKIDDNKIIHSLNSLVNSILKCKEELHIENDDFMRIAKFEQDLDSSKVSVNGESMTIFTYLCNGINTSPIENTPNIINTYSLEKITINNSDYEKSTKENVMVTVFSDFLIITKDIQKSNKDNLKSQLVYPPIPLKEVSITERKVPKHLQKYNHLDNGFDSIKLKNEDISSLNYTDFLFELRCTNPQIFIVLQTENDNDRETFINSIIMQRNYILNDNHEIYFDNIGQVIVSSTKPKVPQISIEGEPLSTRGMKINGNDNRKSISNMSIEVENPINESNENNNENIDIGGFTDRNDMILTEDLSKFNNTTIFQAICSPYYFKQNEWIKMPRSILCINQNTDGRNFITLNASATGRILLNEYICPDSVIKQSSKNENVIQIKTKSRGLFSIRFSKNDTPAYTTLLNFSKNLIKDSIIWTYEKKEELFLIENTPSLDETYDLVIKNNIEDTSNSFKLYCEKTTKYEIVDHLYVKEGNNWISLGLSKISIVIPNYIMENDIENSENMNEMELLSQNSIEPIITAHSLTDIKKPGSIQSLLMCFLRAPINQDCIILKNKNIHDDNVYELNFMFEEKIYEYMIYSKKTDNSLAFVSEYINKLSNYYSKILEEEKYDPEFFTNPDILVGDTENQESEEQDNNSIDNNSNSKDEEKEGFEGERVEEEEENENEDEDESASERSNSIAIKENLLANFTFMTTSEKPPLIGQSTESPQTQTPQTFLFDMNDFSSNDKSTENEKDQNSASIFSGFTLSSSIKQNENISENNSNDQLALPLLSTKQKFVVPALNANTFEFSFNSTTKKETSSTTTNPLFGNMATTTTTTTTTANPLFGNIATTTTTNSNPLFNNKPGLFGNTTNTLIFDNTKSFEFNFSSNKKQAQPQNTTEPIVTEKPLEKNEIVAEEETKSVEKNEVVEEKETINEINENCVNEEASTKIENQNTTEVIMEKENDSVLNVPSETKDSEKKEDSYVNESSNNEKEEEKEEKESNESKSLPLYNDDINEIKKENHIKYNYPEEVNVSTSGTLFDVSEPYNEVKRESKLKKQTIFNDTPTTMDTNEQLISFKYHQFIRSCDDLVISVNKIEIPIREFSLDSSDRTKDIMKDSIANLKFEINKIRSIFNDSDTSIITYCEEESPKSNENLTSKTSMLKKSKSTTEFEMKFLFNDCKKNKTTEVEESDNKKLSIQKYIDNYKNSIQNPDNKIKLSVKEEIKSSTIKEERDVKTNKVADIILTINNNMNTCQTSLTVKKEEGCITQNYVDKMTKEFMMKELNNNSSSSSSNNNSNGNKINTNNTNSLLEKGSKVKCLRLSPAIDENLTNEELLSVYIKSLRPVKRQENNKVNNENNVKEKSYYQTNEDRYKISGRSVSSSIISSSMDSITSYYKYVENGKIEMTSTGNMNMNEAFDLVRYKIKILRKQLDIERRAREDITEDYLALREELRELIKKTELLNESFIMEREAGMEKDDYIQLLEEKIKMYENTIQRHNETYPDDNIPLIENDTVLEFLQNNQAVEEDTENSSVIETSSQSESNNESCQTKSDTE